MHFDRKSVLWVSVSPTGYISLSCDVTMAFFYRDISWCCISSIGEKKKCNKKGNAVLHRGTNTRQATFWPIGLYSAGLL